MFESNKVIYLLEIGKEGNIKVIKIDNDIYHKYEKIGVTGNVVEYNKDYYIIYFDDYPHTAYDTLGERYNKSGWLFQSYELELCEELKPGDKVIFISYKENVSRNLFKDIKMEEFKPGDKVIYIPNKEDVIGGSGNLITELQETYGYLVIKDSNRFYYITSTSKTYRVKGSNFGIPVEYLKHWSNNESR